MNAFLTIIKKIGEKIISVVEWPFKHSAMLEHALSDIKKDTPATCDALVGLVQHFEALGVDGIQAIAAHGLNVPEDIKVGADVKAIFSHFMDVVCPAIESECADLKKDLKPAPAAADNAGNSDAGSAPAAPAPAPGPGLTVVVPE